MIKSQAKIIADVLIDGMEKTSKIRESAGEKPFDLRDYDIFQGGFFTGMMTFVTTLTGKHIPEEDIREIEEIVSQSDFVKQFDIGKVTSGFFKSSIKR